MTKAVAASPVEEALALVQQQLFGELDELRRQERRLTDNEICVRMWAIARNAERQGLLPAATVTRRALASGASRAGLVHAFPAIEDAVRLGTDDGPTTDQLLARLAVRLAG